MAENSGNGTGTDRPRTPVDRWETLEVLFSAQEGEFGIELAVQRPVFVGGRTGRPGLGCVVTRGERGLRLTCRDGSMDEITSLRAVLRELTPAKLLELGKEYEKVMKDYPAPPRREPQSSDRLTGNVGGGLSRFSKMKRSRSHTGSSTDGR